MIYAQFFGVREAPFDLTPNPRFLMFTSVHQEALSNLQYGIAARKGITLLVGEAGTGKTTMIRAAIERQPARVHCVHLHNPALTRAEFVSMLAARLELSSAARTCKTTLLLELEQLLLRRRSAGETTVLIVDEAQSLPIDLLEEIRLLANFETHAEKLLPVVLAGQPQLGVRLSDEALQQFKQRIALRCELRPLTAEETVGYVAGRLRAAGGMPGHMFTRDAIRVIHERSKGIPRTINVLCDNALLTAFAMGQKPVTRQVVVDVCRDFDVRASDAEEPRLPEDHGRGQESRPAAIAEAAERRRRFSWLPMKVARS